MQPTVFADVGDALRISREEIFGPVQCIDKFSTLDEAIRRANDSAYGLAAGVFSNDLATVNRLTRAIRAGTVWVGNSYNTYDAAVPFGARAPGCLHAPTRGRGVHAVAQPRNRFDTL